MLASQAAAAIAGRTFVTPDDVKDVAAGVVPHRLIVATDAYTGGRRHAARLAALATEAAVRFAAILPPDGLNDWNDALRALTPAL